MCECVCMTKTLAASGALCHHKVVNYSVRSAVVHNSLIFIKKNNNPRVSRFLARQMALTLIADDELPKLSESDTVVCFLPRSREALLKYGHDQSALLAGEVARELGFSCLDALGRNRSKKVKAQKKLNAKERAKNAKKTYVINDLVSDEINGKKVILVDDIVTTGASAAACVSLLIRAGAAAVIVLSVASTEGGK